MHLGLIAPVVSVDREKVKIKDWVLGPTMFGDWEMETPASESEDARTWPLFENYFMDL